MKILSRTFHFSPGDTVIPDVDLDVDVSIIGLSFALSERIRLKGQFLEGNIGSNTPEFITGDRFRIGSVAISVIF